MSRVAQQRGVRMTESLALTRLEPALTYVEAAEKLNNLGYAISVNWLRNRPEVPRIKVGHEVRFT